MLYHLIVPVDKTFMLGGVFLLIIFVMISYIVLITLVLHAHTICQEILMGKYFRFGNFLSKK